LTRRQPLKPSPSPPKPFPLIFRNRQGPSCLERFSRLRPSCYEAASVTSDSPASFRFIVDARISRTPLTPPLPATFSSCSRCKPFFVQVASPHKGPFPPDGKDFPKNRCALSRLSSLYQLLDAIRRCQPSCSEPSPHLIEIAA